MEIYDLNGKMNDWLGWLVGRVEELLTMNSFDTKKTYLHEKQQENL